MSCWRSDFAAFWMDSSVKSGGRKICGRNCSIGESPARGKLNLRNFSLYAIK
jgi:hypothetical protein